jgi:opacity protein-like surface antigen
MVSAMTIQENNMNKHSSWFAALLMAVLAVPALAQDEAGQPSRYASASSLNWQIEGGDVAKGSGLRLTFGHQLGDYLSVELHGGLGGGSSDGAFDIGLKELLGGYLRASYPLTEYLNVYGLYGYSRVKLDVDDLGAGTSSSETETGGSYGGGVEFKVLSGLLDGRLRLTADYIVYLDKRGGEFVARSAGLRLDF